MAVDKMFLKRLVEEICETVEKVCCLQTSAAYDVGCRLVEELNLTPFDLLDAKAMLYSKMLAWLN